MPHISLLAPAILTAMQGPPNSSTQGLRTLELCIDNMSNDYLYEQLEPVKKELMKALWGIMMTGNGQMQTTALRFLGKMCGHALKAIREPQQLHPKMTDDDVGPCLMLHMPNISDALHVPIFRVIEEAYKTLLEATFDLNTRNAAWNVVQSYLLGILRPDPSMQSLETLLLHPGFKQAGKTGGYSVVTALTSDIPYAKCTDEKSRMATQTCLQGLMVAAATKDFRTAALPLFAKFVRHFSLMAICQQSGVYSKPETPGARGFHTEAIDPYVIVDAIIFILGHEEQAISKTGDAGIILIVETLKAVYEDLKHCVMLPFLNYLFEKLHSLCYEKAWCCKAGALTGISLLIEYMPLSWTIENSVLLTRALIFVLRDSFQNMTYGIIEVTKKLLDKILRRVLSPPDHESLPQDIQNLRLQAIQEIIREFVLSSTCVVEDVRTQAMDGLLLFSQVLEQSLGKVLEPHQKLIAEFVPPKRPSTMKSYQMNHQLALLEANRFFLNVTGPTVASYDPNRTEDVDVITEVLEFLKMADEPLQKKYQCFDFRQYYPLSFLPWRIAAFRFVTVFANFQAVSPEIHKVLLDTLTAGSDDLLDVATECLAKFAASSPVGRNSVTEYLATVKATLEAPGAFTRDLTDRLVRLQTVYPDLFDEDFAQLTFDALRPNLETAAAEQREIPHVCDGVKKCGLMITLLGRTTKDRTRYVNDLLDLIVQTEEALMTRNGRQLTAALSSFLHGYGTLVVDVFFQNDRILEPKWTAFLEKLLRGKDDFQGELKALLTTEKVHLLTNMITFTENTDQQWQSLSVGIRILYLLAKKHSVITWLASSPDIIDKLRNVWRNPDFNARLRSIMFQPQDTWELSVKFLVLLMVNARTHPNDFDALFEMTRHSSRSMAEGSRWRQFVECQMVTNLEAKTRRQMVLKWLDMVKNKTEADEYLADICDLIIQPIVKQQFMQGSADLMINESPSSPEAATASSSGAKSPAQGNLIQIVAQVLLLDDPLLLFKTSELLRVCCLKLLVIFTEQAENFFPEPRTDQNNLMSRFSVLASQLLLKRDREHIQIDVGTIYQAQNLLAQISARGQVAARYVPSILRSLFQGGQIEPRSANKGAIDVLLPNLLTKNPDTALLLCSFLRKAIMEDPGNISQVTIIFQAIVRHRLHFFPFRHNFVALMFASAQKLGLINVAQTSLDQKRTAVDILECLVSWEALRKNLEVDYGDGNDVGNAPGAPQSPSKPAKQPKRPSQVPPPKEERQLDAKIVDGIANVLLRLSFVVGEPAANDSLGRRCFRILKFYTRRDMYPNADMRMQWLERILVTVDQINAPPKSENPQQPPPNPIPSVCLALETLTYFIPNINRQLALGVINELSPSLMKVTTCFNARVAKCMNSLISTLCALWPGDPVSRNLPSQLEGLYSHLIKVIHEGLTEFERISPGPQTHIFCTLMLLKATMPYVPTILDRFLTLVANAAKKIMDEHLGIGKAGQPIQTNQSQQDGFVSAELVVVVLDVIKVPAFFTSSGNQGSHRGTIIGIMSDLIGRSSDVRVHRALIRIFNEWLVNPERDGREPSTSAGGGSSGGAGKPGTPKPVRKPKKKREEEEFVAEPESSSLDEKMAKKKKKPKQAPFMDANLPPMPMPLPLVDDIQTVTPKELSQLILKLQIQIERKFVEDSELQSLYTTLIYKIFSHQDERMMDLQQRLSNAYMYGLRHPDPEWRKKFYAIHDRHFSSHMFERLNGLFTGFSWDACTLTYYVGFCINTILGLANNQLATMATSLHNAKLILPVSALASDSSSGQHPENIERRFSGMSESINDAFENGSPEISSDETPKLKELSVGTIVERVYKLNDLTRATSVRNFLEGVFQLCHMKNQLANDVWVLVLPQIWKLLNGEQRDLLVTSFR
ncbi:Transformation/transcription domain-associated protein [Hypsibius exemplaris]|uniref:Transformation/transcription domain-associated protein n=1 Tax=Hypsibius exemplaris TaxID=2072580 RepID=A0A1W0WAE9_HYPEX|nr:Transformation/transcription domain-associated protein [Hypsibius exemplaris]